MTFTPKSIQLPGRVRLSYVEQGSADGVPLLLLHGYPDSWRSFELLLPLLPASVRALAPSQRGMGDSERPAAGYLPDDFAGDAAAFLDVLGVPAAVVVGHSMGSHIAQRFAIDFPQRTLGLVLVGAFATLQGNPAGDELWQGVSQLTDPVDPAFAWEFQKSAAALPVPDWFMQAIVRDNLKVPARVWKDACRGLIESDLRQELARLQAPTLIVWGERDAFFGRRDQDVLLAGIQGSHLLVYPGVGHGPHWEMPERFAADLLEFVGGLPQRSSAVQR
jgi:non-heme chloroperoxidase